MRGEVQGECEIVEKMYFNGLLDFVYVELMKDLQKGFVPKRCANCRRWFLQTPGATYSYCNEPAPGQGGKICREIGAAKSFKEKVDNNDIWKIHQRAYKKYFARVSSCNLSFLLLLHFLTGNYKISSGRFDRQSRRGRYAAHALMLF